MWLLFPVLFLPVAGSADDHRLAVMGEPVQSGDGLLAIAKYIWQFIQAAVSGDASGDDISIAGVKQDQA